MKSLGYRQPFDVQERVGYMMPQQITNSQAFDVVYGSHKAYYDDKRFTVFDKNFDKVEENLLNQFKSTIDSAVEYTKKSKLEHVDYFDRNRILLPQNVQENAPRIHPETVQSNPKYEMEENSPKPGPTLITTFSAGTRSISKPSGS